MHRYQPGDRILKNHPFSYVLEGSRRGQVCEYCFAPDPSAKRCAKCKITCYCSAECQINCRPYQSDMPGAEISQAVFPKKAWKENHKHECGGLLRTGGKLSSFMQLLAQTVLKLKLGLNSEDPSRNETPFQRTFYDLASHWSEAKEDKEIAAYVAESSATLSSFFDDPSYSDLLQYDSLGEIYSRIKSNAYSIQGPMNECIGHGLFLSAGKFDHSCRPNACQSYDGPDMLVYAIDSIAALEDVRVTYAALNQPTRLRRQYLKDQYFFHCECVGCQDPIHDAFIQSAMCVDKNCGEAVPFKAQVPGEYKCAHCGTKCPDQSVAAAEDLMSQAEVALKQMESRTAAGDFITVVKLADPILRDASGLLHPKNFVICTMSLLCSSAYTSMNNLPMAFTFSQNALEGTTFAYPNKHIAVGSHLLQLIQIGLEMRIRDKTLYEDLELLAKNSVDIAAIATGIGSSVYKKALEMLMTLSTALRAGLPSAIQQQHGHHHGHGGGCCSHHH